MEYVYIMACQRGQAAHEIHSMWDTYDKAIKAYYDYHMNEDYFKRGDDLYDYWFMYLYRFPVNQMFANSRGSSDIKFGKSSKFRVKFKNHGELRKEYLVVSRDTKIDSILN